MCICCNLRGAWMPQVSSHEGISVSKIERDTNSNIRQCSWTPKKRGKRGERSGYGRIDQMGPASNTAQQWLRFLWSALLFRPTPDTTDKCITKDRTRGVDGRKGFFPAHPGRLERRYVWPMVSRSRRSSTRMSLCHSTWVKMNVSDIPGRKDWVSLVQRRTKSYSLGCVTLHLLQCGITQL